MLKLSLCLTKHHSIKTYWGIGGIAPRILTSVVDGVSGQLHALTALIPGKEPPLLSG
jgi:hypothetical protein